MPIQHAIWKVWDKPTPLSTSRLASEQKLEEMIVPDLRVACTICCRYFS
jgi:hypothetical protein